MRKVIGIGETIMDIVFECDEPLEAVVGGAVFNTMVSLTRVGVPTCFISETGNDPCGRIILDFMQDNRMTTNHIAIFQEGQTPISLAFLNELHDAEYVFYKRYPINRLDVAFPSVETDDIVVLGSFFALDPDIRDKVVELLEQARNKKAIVYYDPNFRADNKNRKLRLASIVMENFEYADIVRASKDDFVNMYGCDDVDKVYRDKIAFYCPRLIYTRGGDGVSLRADKVKKEYPIERVEVVNTIGAGDNFNAGIIYGLLRNNVKYDDLGHLNETTWDELIGYGQCFAAEACQSRRNYISLEFAAGYRI